MALQLFDRVQVAATANTTVSFTLGSAVAGYQSFATAGVTNGNTVYYSSSDGTNWEVGIGTYSTTGPTLTRTTILSSSNAGSAVTFTSAPNVWIDYPSSKAVYLDASSNVTLPGSISFSGSNKTFQADFTNATVLNRFLFQTSTTNSTTGIYAVPNGTAVAASWQATNAADPTNASKILIATNGSTDVQLVSGINGTGTYLPLSFYTNGSQSAQLDTSANFKANGQLIARSEEHTSELQSH